MNEQAHHLHADRREILVTLGLSLAKGAAMTAAVLVLASSEPYWHQLLLVVISAALTSAGLIISALLTSRRQQRIIRKVDDLKAATGIDRRESDP